ncbi:hypothetical protein VTO42DRAFT_3966 [Malbranchea cinnamomea]
MTPEPQGFSVFLPTPDPTPLAPQMPTAIPVRPAPSNSWSERDPLPEPTSTTPAGSPPARNPLDTPDRTTRVRFTVPESTESPRPRESTPSAFQLGSRESSTSPDISTPTRTIPGALPMTPILRPETPELAQRLETPSAPARPIPKPQHQDELCQEVNRRLFHHMMTQEVSQDVDVTEINTNPDLPALRLHEEL